MQLTVYPDRHACQVPAYAPEPGKAAQWNVEKQSSKTEIVQTRLLIDVQWTCES